MDKARILVVEDEFIIAQAIENSLEMMGYDIAGTVTSGEKAIENTASKKPDLILMDIQLKGKMDGIEAADHIRTRFNVPVIFLTAHSECHLIQRATSAGSSGYLIKPFKNQALKSAIEKALFKSGRI